MRVVPLGLAALLWTGAALAQTTLAQTNTPHTDPGRSGITDAPVGAQAAPGATRGAVTGLGDADRGGQTGATVPGATVPGTTAQGTPQGPSAITNAPVGAGSSGTAQQGTTRP